jgi:AcrR family transcriptional regulator
MAESAEEVAAADPLRGQLLDAAARVFAAKGYSGTKIQDIVREAGLSTGAVYGRFSSKDHLLREAVLAQRNRFASGAMPAGMRVAELIQRLAAVSDAPLSVSEAVRLEAFVTARREADVAEAVAEAQRDWREVVQPLVDKAIADGTVAADVDPEAVLYFVRTIALGLLLQRAAGLPGPDPAGWDALVRRIVASFGDAKVQAKEQS